MGGRAVIKKLKSLLENWKLRGCSTEILDTCVGIVEIGEELNRRGVLSVDITFGSGVHLNGPTEWFKAIPGPVIQINRECEQYPWEFHKYYKGVKFYYITEGAK
jgi:hypothetical protein